MFLGVDFFCEDVVKKVAVAVEKNRKNKRSDQETKVLMDDVT